MRIAYLQACKAIDSENKIKQQSPHSHAYSHTDPPIHAHMHALFNSQPLMHHFFTLSLTLSHSSTMKAIELNHCRWQFSAICLVVVVGGGHFNRRRRRRRHNKLQRSATHGRAAQRCLCLLLFWLRCPFAFRIPRPDAANEALSTASCGVRS